MRTAGPDSGAVEDQLQALRSITEAAVGRLDVDDLLLELLERIRRVLGADTAAVLMLDEKSQQLVARAARGVEEEVRQGVRIPLGKGFAGRIAAERRPLMIDHVDETTVQNPVLWEKGIKAMLGVPLLSGSRAIGVLHVGVLDDRRFTTGDATLLELIADQVTAAVQSRELEVERAAARVLQRSLLPSGMPRCPEFAFATRYVPAERGGVGGDWYDAFLLPSGDLWVMVGDVAGHGLGAATVMGRLRSSLRSYALIAEGGPEEVLARAGAKLQFFEPGRMATVLSAVLRPPYDSIRIASAGHLPPVLAVPGGPSSLLELRVWPPLGVVTKTEPHAIEAELPEGAVLVGYTDGLIERRGESLDVGFARLAGAVKVGDPEMVCRDTMDALVGNAIPRDDIAVIALRRNAA